MALLHYISYIAIVLAFGFVTMSLASGLLYISELIEEYSRLSKLVGQRGIYVIILLHIALYLTDGLPFHLITFSIICHIVYLQNFSNTWPFISLTSISFVSSCVLVMVDHFLWFFYFSKRTHEARHTAYRGGGGAHARNEEAVMGFASIATFFGLCVWLAPLFLFLSLSANDNALPTSGSGNEPSSTTNPTLSSIAQTHGASHTRTRSSLFKSLFDILPRIRPSPSSSPFSSRKEQEGLIAPRSPHAPHFATPNTPTRSLSFPPPPRSPSPGGSVSMSPRQDSGDRLFSWAPELEPKPKPGSGSDFSLSPPPAGRPLGKGGVMGLRRVSASGRGDEQ